MLAIGTCIPLGIAGSAWVIGSLLIAACQRPIGDLPGDLVGEAVAFPSRSGACIAGWYVPGASGAGVVMLLHGLRGSRLDMIGRARFLHRAGFSVLLFDFAGHGESGGSFISFGYHEAEDVDAAIDFVMRRAPGERIGAIACSMGAASLVLARGKERLHAMVLECMYATFEDAVGNRIAHRLGGWARSLTPLLTWQLRPRLGFGTQQLRPIDAVAGVRVPKLVLAGGVDPLTPPAESESIYARAGEPKELWVIPDAGHVDLHAHAAAGYEARILGFLRATLR